MIQKDKWEILRKTLWGFIILYGISLYYLFYKQTQWTGGAVYESDLPAHIKMIVVDGWYYSLTAFVYKFCYMTPIGDYLVAGFLAICGVLSIVFSYRLLQKAEQPMNNRDNTFCLAAAWIINMVMGCYIKGVADGRYIGMQSASIWHNSTYLVMKMAALGCLLCYVDLANCYSRGIPAKKWGVFTLLLMICTAIKPSFLLVFAPMMAIFLLLDLFQKVAFKRILMLGVAVVPSCLVILLQNAILFGQNTGNGWEIRPGYGLTLHSGHPFISAILSILFPLLIGLVHCKDFQKDRWFLGAWLMALFGFTQVFLFCETGGRASDGNFMWGYSFAILGIFAVSIQKWWQDCKIAGRSKWMAFSCIVGGLVLLYHLYCGVYFYVNLLRGVSYWMWD